MATRPSARALDGIEPSLVACVQSLAVDKAVEVWGGSVARYRDVFAEAASLGLARAKAGTNAELLVCLAAGRADEFLSSGLPTQALDGGAIVIAWSNDTNLVGPPAAYVAHYTQRAISGVLVREAQFAASKVAALHEAPDAPAEDYDLWLWSNNPIPPLQTGFFQGSDVAVVQSRFVAPVLDTVPADQRAIALTRRLLDVEDRTLSLRSKILGLTQALSESNQTGGQSDKAFDAPRTRHEWPMANSNRKPGSLSLYDVRSDDAVIAEAELGAEFFAAFRLEESEPDFAGAVAAINALARVMRTDADQPDVSIIIPVYGQLAYTLNCIHSLWLHASRYSAEVIIIDDCSPDGGLTEQFVPQVEGVRYHKQPKNGGFIKSCNTGGELAVGRYVLMLNNDTRVVDGWLDNIIDSFALFPRSGLIGSKMLYPDGVLQEAGGILWRDGSAWNYGRNDDPNRPQYCFARQVDYISGCSLVLTAELWRELGGFDPHYTPAYAEDADLCQRVSARGLEVWYQPASRVIHYEGKTSGTQTTGGGKAYQLINLRKLYLRWRGKFVSHRRNSDAPYFEKERSVTKRMLFVDAVTPTPDQDAGSLQTVLGLQCAQRAGYKAHFVPEDNWLFDPKYTPGMQREGVECFHAPFEIGFENFIRRYGWLFDIIIVYRVGVMQKSLAAIREYAPNATVLFHLADLHYLRLQRQADLEQNEELAKVAAEMKEKELSTILQSDCTITHSTVEAEILAAEVPGAQVTVWPLMMEVAGARARFEARKAICFLGGYRHPPNIDAVLYFVEEVLPLIHAVEPDIEFIVAGANPTPEISELAGDKVIVTGMIDDLADVFEISRVFVCPLRVGAGAKGKVLSALAHGVPVVSTAIGVEGAGLVEDEHVLIADDPQAMADSVLRVYHDANLWRNMSRAGLALVNDQFSLAMGVGQLEEAIEKGLRKRLDLLGA